MRKKLFRIAELYRTVFYDLNQNPHYITVANRVDHVAEHGTDDECAAVYNEFVACIGGMQ